MIAISVLQPGLLYYKNAVSSGPLIPLMTSNSTPSGFASSIDNNGNEYMAFDGNDSDGWYGSNHPLNTIFIEYQFPGSNTVTSYSVIIPTFRIGISIVLQGSNNGSTWINLDSPQATPIPTLTVFNISNSTSYWLYRLILVGTTAVNNIQINSWQLYGY